jgi:SAM-dependent methyltransferase
MNWRVKALAQQVFSHVPAGSRLNYLMQTKVTRSLPAPAGAFDQMADAARHHLGAVTRALGVTDAATLRGYEFGAGWHLGVAVGLSAQGVAEQTLVDREVLAQSGLLRHTFSSFTERFPDSERLRTAAKESEILAVLAILGIDYRAPVDARATGLPAGSFDFVTSTSTLEHIPATDLPDLLTECHRLLRPGGVLSAMIDYGDHYAAFDPSINRLNFLRYSPRRWRRYSPPLQYQNRLRHSDYLGYLGRAGFEIVGVTAIRATEAEVEWAAGTSLDAAFDRYDIEDLVTVDSHIVAVKR